MHGTPLVLSSDTGLLILRTLVWFVWLVNEIDYMKVREHTWTRYFLFYTTVSWYVWAAYSLLILFAQFKYTVCGQAKVIGADGGTKPDPV